MYFADKVGESGQVFCYEFVPRNIAIMRRQFELNPRLTGRIRLVQNAVWSCSGESLHYEDHGTGTQVRSGDVVDARARVETLSIDDMVTRERLERLDFIKMDIEGAELAALKGAEVALRRFAPKLAVCVYHRFSDFFDIPDYLLSLDLGYRLYLRHFSIHGEETVLFATRA